MELEDYFDSQEFKSFKPCKRIYIRIKIAFYQVIKMF